MGGTTSSGNMIYAEPIGDKAENGSRTYRSVKSLDKLMCFPREDIQTLKDVMLNSFQEHPDRPMLGTRGGEKNDYQWRTYSEVKSDADALGVYLTENKLYHTVENQPHDMNLIGVFAKNRDEWLTIEQANILYGFTFVPLYDTLGPESIGYVLNQTELTTIFMAGSTVANLLMCENPGNVKNLILLDKISEEEENKVKAKGWTIAYYSEILSEYKGKSGEYPEITPEHIFTFSYTSGTTGDPKGALISHRNLTSICYITDVSLETKITKTDLYLSYLPLPHIFERIMVYAMLYNGGCIGFYSGDVTKLKDDIATLRPTIFASVPRLYTRFFDAIRSKIDALSGLKGHLARKGLETKAYHNEIDNSVFHKLWDKLVFNKTKAALGGRVKLACTGSAPISTDVLKFLKITLCVPIQEGYGSTETTGATFQTSIYDPKVGHVGGINPNMEYKLEDIPDMNYLSTDKDADGNDAPRGEICVRGHCVFKGYYKLPEKTAEAIDKDGWLHTGDVGLILPNGALKIIDRKKNLFKLAQGEYVAPEKIENIYVTSPWVDEVWIHGDSLQPHLVTFAVANKVKAEEWAKEKGINETYEQLIDNKDLRKTVIADMVKLGKQQKLFGFEQAKNIKLVGKPFIEFGITTNTFKVKRKDARDYFANDIKALYEQPL